MERKDSMIDEIVAESKTNNSKKEFNKEEWAKKKTEVLRKHLILAGVC